MSKKLITNTVTIPTDKGEKKHFSFRVVDSETGQVVEAYSTTKKKDAKNQYENLQKKYPDIAAEPSSGLKPWDDEAPEIPAGNYDVPLELMDRRTRNLVLEADPSITDFCSPSPSPTSANSPIKKSKLSKKARDLSGMSKKRREKYEKLSEAKKQRKKLVVFLVPSACKLW